MKGLKPLKTLTLCCLMLGANPAHAADRNVRSVADDPVSTYDLKADYFVQGQALAKSAFTLPAPVLEESPKGYVKVTVQGRDVWLDLMDVAVYPPKSSGTTGCVATGTGQKANVGRGIGEDCK
jgi:hypothetical protein